MVTTVPAVALAAWGFDDAATIEPITMGLVNLTFKVQQGDRRVALSRLHPIFDARVNEDIENITAWLASQGMATPRLVRTQSGELSFTANDGVWRALGWIDGEVLERADGPQRSRAAGRLVGRFHGALAGHAHEFAFRRPDAHDFARHLRDLATALETHTSHHAHAEVATLAAKIFDHARDIPPAPALPRRIIHGDLKLTNLLFDAQGEGLAVLDLDTLCHGRMDVELGDALRSWCNPAGEDDAQSEVDVSLLEAALSGFEDTAPGLLSQGEWRAVIPGMERIALELSSRFARDALEEQRFGWNAQKFASRAEHGLRRARSQLALAASVRARTGELAALVQAIVAT